MQATATNKNLLKISVFGFQFLILLFICFPSLAAAQDDEIINVESSIVLLNATITDANGKTVGGLKESQFKVFEDGQEQKIDFY
ncbi:MAG: hypothetical protein ACR2HG_13875, partial [Pyrinomonadaceae bacterium]